MARFKFTAHENGMTVPDGGTITVKGVKILGQLEQYELEVEPGEEFDIPDEWAYAIQCLEAVQNPSNPSTTLYTRVS
jgi:hypothetical protein